VSDSAARGPRYTIHDGFRMPMGFPVAGFDSGQRYRAAPGDIFVASYPKCGTTWTQYIVYLLENDGRPLARNQRLEDKFPHLEEVGEEAVRALPSPRLIKTHLPYARTPRNPQAKYVYVARNPFDCAVSFYHHTRGFVRHYDFAEGAWDTFFECFMRGEVDFGDYFDHLDSWWPQRSEANLLFLTYERMLAAPEAATRAIAEFLGGRAGELAHDARRLDAVVRDSGFTQMQRDQQRWSSERPADMPAFVRKGVVGDWRNHFSPAQARRLAEKCERFAAVEDLWPGLVADALE
jgi:sulfotransferase